MSKYKNKKTVVDNIQFDSMKEAARYVDLKMLQQMGKIKELKLQPEFRLKVGGKLICKYRADFEYDHQGKRVIEDVKGMRTALYRLKKKLMFAIHGIDIHEV